MLVLVRHGQSVLNAEGRLAGRLDVPLTDAGVDQAEAVAGAVLAMGRPARVISSPLQRAQQTAAALGLPVDIDDRWVELDYGSYDGLALSDVPPGMWDAWRADAEYAPPEGESLAAVGRRVREACDEWVAGGPDPDANIVVVSHVSPIKAAVAWALGVEDRVSWRMFLAPGSITLIAAGPRGPSLHAFNTTSHLGL